MPSNVTSEERQRAKLLARDRAEFEAFGVRKSQRITALIRRDSIRAFKNGGDPLSQIDTRMIDIHIALMEMMVGAHLKGMIRTKNFNDAWKAKRGFLAGPYLGVTQRRGRRRTPLDYLESLSSITPIQLVQLKLAYGEHVSEVVDQLSGFTQGHVGDAMRDAISQGLHVKDATKLLRKGFDTAGMSAISSSTIESIFKTQTLMAYSAGRWDSLQAPEIQSILWGYKYVTVGDDRVRDRHDAMDGITLPKDDPFWSRNFPPNGWNCRCVALEIFNDEIPEVVEPEPLVEADGTVIFPIADKGFGFNPGKLFGRGFEVGGDIPPIDGRPDTKPKKKKPVKKATKKKVAKKKPIKKVVKKVTKKKVVKKVTPKPKPVKKAVKKKTPKVKPSPTPKPKSAKEAKPKVAKKPPKTPVKSTHAENVRKKFENKNKNIQSEIDKLQDARTSQTKAINDLKSKKDFDGKDDKLRSVYQSRIETNQKILKLQSDSLNNFIASTGLKDGVKLNLKKDQFDGAKEAERVFGSLVSKKALGGKASDYRPLMAKHGKSRAYASEDKWGGTIHASKKTSASTLVHELGHTLEFANPSIKTQARNFLDKRTKGDEIESLKKITGDPYGKSEVTKKDKFFNPYVGKQYKSGDTEIISMGIERLMTHSSEFAKKDPEYFDFMVNILAGKPTGF